MKKGFFTFLLVFTLIFNSLPILSFAASKTASAVFSSKDAVCENVTVRHGADDAAVNQKEGVNGWELIASDGNASCIYFNVKDTFMRKLPSDVKVTVDVKYYDNSRGGFAIFYSAQGDTTNSQYCQLTNSGSWKTVTFTLDDAYFSNNILGYDIVILNNDSKFGKETQKIMGKSSDNVLISEVTIQRSEKLAPFVITAETEHPGNIFFEGDTMDFAMKFTDPEGKYTSGTAKYTVTDDYGKEVYCASYPFTDGKYTLTMPKLPFGIYVLNVDVTGEAGRYTIEQSKIIDFSYSKKSSIPNDRFGTNVHFQRTHYGRDDIKTAIDLAKNCGLKFLRTSISWNQIELERGVYALPDNIEYSNKYADESGLEILGILTGDTAYTINGYKLGCGSTNKPDTPEEIKAYEDYCYWTVNALKDYTSYWSYINEYNLKPGGAHDPSTKTSYAPLVNAAYDDIKRADPNAFVVAGEVGSYWPDRREWIEDAYSKGVLNGCEAFSIHVYDQLGSPQSWYLYGSMQNFNDDLKKRNPSKQAWITESGWPSNGTDNYVHSIIPYEAQGAWYAQSLGLNSDPERIDKCIYYSFIDNNIGYFDIEDNYGILHAHDWRTPYAAKSAYLTVAAFNSILGGYNFVKDLDGDHESLMNNGWECENYKDVWPKDYSDSKFRRIFRNSDGDEILMVWGEVNWESYKYESDKKYFEVYDMFGNKTILENTTGSYTGTYSSTPVYIHATNAPMEGEIKVDSMPSAWTITEDDRLDVHVTLSNNIQVGTDVCIIAAAYDKNGKITNVQTRSRRYKGSAINVNFSTEEMVGCDDIKIFVFDSFSKIKPLVKCKIIPDFYDDNSVSYVKVGDKISVSGTLEGFLPYANVLVTVLKGDTAKEDLIEGGFDDSVIYQDMIKTDANGKYSFEIKLTDKFNESKIKLILGHEQGTVQKIINLK